MQQWCISENNLYIPSISCKSEGGSADALIIRLISLIRLLYKQTQSSGWGSELVITITRIKSELRHAVVLHFGKWIASQDGEVTVDSILCNISYFVRHVGVCIYIMTMILAINRTLDKKCSLFIMFLMTLRQNICDTHCRKLITWS